MMMQNPIEFEPLENDIPGTSTNAEDPLEMVYGQEGDRRAPQISPTKHELKENMDRVTNDLEKDCMERESKSLHHAPYSNSHSRQLPYAFTAISSPQARSTVVEANFAARVPYQ